MTKLFLYALVFVLFINMNLYAKVNYFLKIEGIEGESIEPNHRNEIECIDLSYSIKVPSDRPTGLATGKRQHSPFVITKELDKASPKLAKACCNGEHIKEAILTCRRTRSDGSLEEYFTIKFKDAIISSYSLSGAGEADRPMETITLNFTKIEWEYKPEGIVYEDQWRK